MQSTFVLEDTEEEEEKKHILTDNTYTFCEDKH